MKLLINHASVCEGGPTHVTVPDGATTIAQVIELFKEQTGATQRIRLRAATRELRLADTLDAAGIADGHELLAIKNASGSAAYQALRRVERGITRQTHAHGVLMGRVDEVGTAVRGGFDRVEAGVDRVEAGVGRVEERLERALAIVAPEQSAAATPREQLTFLQNRRATDLNHIRLLRDSVRRHRDESAQENVRPRAKAKAEPKAEPKAKAEPRAPECTFVLTRGQRRGQPCGRRNCRLHGQADESQVVSQVDSQIVSPTVGDNVNFHNLSVRAPAAHDEAEATESVLRPDVPTAVEVEDDVFSEMLEHEHVANPEEKTENVREATDHESDREEKTDHESVWEEKTDHASVREATEPGEAATGHASVPEATDPVDAATEPAASAEQTPLGTIEPAASAEQTPFGTTEPAASAAAPIDDIKESDYVIIDPKAEWRDRNVVHFADIRVSVQKNTALVRTIYESWGKKLAQCFCVHDFVEGGNSRHLTTRFVIEYDKLQKAWPKENSMIALPRCKSV